jgi:AcrR family transcriptional regulator
MPKIVDREAMQTKILDAGLGCFRAQGYHATKMTDVAEAAGLAKGTLYLYFKRKDAMMVALVRRYFDEIRARITALPDPPDLDSLLEGIRLSMSAERMDATSMFFDVLGPGFEQPEAREVISAFFEWLAQTYAGHLSRMQKTGEVRTDLDVTASGAAICSMLDGLVIHLALFNPDAEEFATRLDAAISILSDGLCVHSGS